MTEEVKEARLNCRMRRSMICTYCQIYKDDQINIDEMGVACGMHGRGKKSVNSFDRNV